MNKDFSKISWDVSESEYRKDPAYNYSLLAKFNRVGFNKLNTLFDKVETPSLSFGSAVDDLLTGGIETFQSDFIISDCKVTDSGISIAKELSLAFKNQYKKFSDIPQDLVSLCAQKVGFWENSKWDKTRYSQVLKTGDIEEYYRLLNNTTKTIINKQTYEDAKACVQALKVSPASKQFFKDNYLSDPNLNRYYQLKFKGRLGPDQLEFRCMADAILVDHEEKVIYPIDLKTTGHPECDFYKSFFTWSYWIQAKLYWALINQAVQNSEDFKDYKVEDYTFIVINRYNKLPLSWIYRDSCKLEKNQYYGIYNQIYCKSPLLIAKELDEYLTVKTNVPHGIKTDRANDIISWTNMQ